MNYPEILSDTVAYGASEAQFNRWNMYGEFTSEELYGQAAPSVPQVERLAPNVAAWDKVLGQLLRKEQ